MTTSFKGPKPSIPVDLWWPITKYYEEDEGRDWIVEGYCTTAEVDLEGDMVLPEALEKAANLCIGLTLLFNHDIDRPVGRIIDAKADDHGIWMKGKISRTEPEIWVKVQERVLDKFSIRFLDGATRPVRKGGQVWRGIVKLIPTEISVTSLPANPGSRAGVAYTQKGGRPMGVKESLAVLQTTLQEILDGVESGEIEVQKSEESKQDAQETDEGYGRNCPFYKTEECPVKEYPSPDQTPAEAKDCKYAPLYTCPFFQTKNEETEETAEEVEEETASIKCKCKECGVELEVASEEKLKGLRCEKCGGEMERVKTEGSETEQRKNNETEEGAEKAEKAEETAEETKSAESPLTADLLGKLTETLKALGSSIQAVAATTKQVGEKLEKLEERVKSVEEFKGQTETGLKQDITNLTEKVKSLSLVTAERKGEEEETEEHPVKKKTSFWDGCVPV